MQWITDGTKNAKGGYIRLWVAEPDGYTNGIWRAEGNVMAHIETYSPIRGDRGPQRVDDATSEIVSVGVERVLTEEQFEEFVALPVTPAWAGKARAAAPADAEVVVDRRASAGSFSDPSPSCSRGRIPGGCRPNVPAPQPLLR